MKRICIYFLLFICILSGCAGQSPQAQVAATTLPVYEFTCRITANTPITVGRLISEPVSCLHDYTLNVRQVKAAEAAEVIVISGGGLEAFMEDLLSDKQTVDASAGLEALECEHSHDHDEEHGHHHEVDAHFWLSPENAMHMASNICRELVRIYPEHTSTFEANLETLLGELEDLNRYGQEALRELSCRDMITFHDGFSYFAHAFGLHILEAVEEESGSEASARELKHLIGIVREHRLPAVFTETYGSPAAAAVICRETGIPAFALDMAMGGNSYFEAMYHNIDIIKEAMG